MPDADPPSFVAFLANHAYRRGDFVLASGARSTEYLAVRTYILRPGIGRHMAAALAAAVNEAGLAEDLVAVAGMGLGAIPLAVMGAGGMPGCLFLPALLIRDQAKAHGMGQRVEGLDNLPEGASRKVVLLEDVVTSGKSVLAALQALREVDPPLEVVGVFAVVDREQGGLDAIRAACPGAHVEALTTLSAIRAAHHARKEG